MSKVEMIRYGNSDGESSKTVPDFCKWRNSWDCSEGKYDCLYNLMTNTIKVKFPVERNPHSIYTRFVWT